MGDEIKRGWRWGRERSCLREISYVNSVCGQWSQLTSLVAFVAGKLTLKDMFT